MIDKIMTLKGLITAPTKTRPVVVYLQKSLAMLSSLRAVIRLLNVKGEINDAVINFPWQDLRYEHIETIRAKLVEKYAPASASKSLTAVKGVLRTAWRMGILDRDTFERSIDVDPIRVNAKPVGRMIEVSEIYRMLDVCGKRDAAIIALAAYSGLRRNEISMLDISDIDGVSVKIRHGKGNKFREVFIAKEAWGFMWPWIDKRGRKPGPLFSRSRRGNHYYIEMRLSSAGVWRVIKQAAERAKINPMITPHDFRRTYASTLIGEGVDLPTVANLMGHANVNTTRTYDRRGDAPKKNAADILAAAFRKPAKTDSEP